MTLWVKANHQSEQFLLAEQTQVYRALGLLPFESYTLHRHPKPLAISPYTSQLAPLPAQLPGAQNGSPLKITLTLPPTTSNQRLGVTLPPASQVLLNDKPLRAESKIAAHFLDNAIYAIPVDESSRQLTITLSDPTHQKRLAVRLLTQIPKDRALCLTRLGVEAETQAPTWLSVLWALVHNDHEKLQTLRPWLEQKLESTSPWKYAFVLLQLEWLEQWRPTFDEQPMEGHDRKWWRALNYFSGLESIRRGRPKAAYRRLKTLELDASLPTKKLHHALFAALLDDAGLSARSAAILKPHQGDLKFLRQRYGYLLNSDQLTESQHLLKQLTHSPHRTRADMYTWLSFLLRAGQLETFHQARFEAILQCPSCWRIFDATGENTFPPLRSTHRFALATQINFNLPRFSMTPTSQDSQPIPSEMKRADHFFTQPKPESKVQIKAPIRNLRLHQHVTIKSNGLTEVRIKRHVRVSRGISNSTVSFALEYVPDRQFIRIRRAILKRNGTNTIVPRETDESTNLPNARLYYDARRRRLTFSGLKPGDLIELDWSVIDHSTDPELPGLSGWLFPLHEQWPTDEFKVSWQTEDKPLFAQLSSTSTQLSTQSITRKHLHNHDAKDHPSSETLMISMVEKWSKLDEIYRLAIKNRFKPTPFLKKIAHSIVGNETNRKKRLERLFKAVQRDVHYVGLELGEHSRIPEFPEQVWRRALGDCKDKAVLLITLARTLDIPLEFALVRSRRLPKLSHALPTLALFDHAIVYAPQDQVYLDPNEPNLGLDRLPALVQGAQSRVLGGHAGLKTIPVNSVDEESIEWSFSPRSSHRGQWQIDLYLKGHATSALLDQIEGGHLDPLQPQTWIATRLPRWTVNDAELNIDTDRASAHFRVRATPLTLSNVRLLHTILSTKSAWFNQTKQELFETHDLPRSFSITLPQTLEWSVDQAVKIPLEGGHVTITTHDTSPKKRIKLKAHLLAPSHFQRTTPSSLIDDLMDAFGGEQ
ncbi:MAG: DUF3857 domain-containing transglutaminase family protein [Bradymonadia bacterium]